MSRIAKSSARMWSDISKQNRAELLGAIELFGKEMIKAKTLIKEEQWDALYAWMQKGNNLHKIF